MKAIENALLVTIAKHSILQDITFAEGEKLVEAIVITPGDERLDVLVSCIASESGASYEVITDYLAAKYNHVVDSSLLAVVTSLVQRIGVDGTTGNLLLQVYNVKIREWNPQPPLNTERRMSEIFTKFMRHPRNPACPTD